MGCCRISLLAGALLLTVVPPAAAQEGLGAVVCVGSELESTANAGPVRRVVQRDVELVYRAAVAFSDRDGIEAGLREELEQTEVRCMWSEPGNTHVVVVKYTGVIPLDLMIDPGDPRFDGFSVGYGTNGGGGRRAGERFRDCPACPEVVVVPAGSFMMGSPESEDGRFDREGPPHRVTIGSPFAVGVYEVTSAEWDACMVAGGCGRYRPEDEGRGRESRPVVNVSWEDAQAYVRWLSRETGEEYRLLTEAEWEYAARAGTQTARYWGERESEQCRYGNGYDRTGHADLDFASEPVSCSDGYVRTAPVGLFEPNGFGLYDVLGNVWEWTQDCSNEGYSGAPADGSAWSAGDCSQRVVRGGAWNLEPRGLRSALRVWFPAGLRRDSNGFRVARTMN